MAGVLLDGGATTWESCGVASVQQAASALPRAGEPTDPAAQLAALNESLTHVASATPEQRRLVDGSDQCSFTCTGSRHVRLCSGLIAISHLVEPGGPPRKTRGGSLSNSGREVERRSEGNLSE